MLDVTQWEQQLCVRRNRVMASNSGPALTCHRSATLSAGFKWNEHFGQDTEGPEDT
jgi:hypothetical protein